MAIYNASKMQAGLQSRILPEGFDCIQISTFVNSTAFLVNDTVNFIQLEGVPTILNNGPVISALTLDLPALDSSTGFTASVGDSTNAARYISGTTAGRSGLGGITYSNVSGSIGYAPFANVYNTNPTVSFQLYTIKLTVTTAASGTPTTGNTLALKVAYTVDP